jgi:hypothetical protein
LEAKQRAWHQFLTAADVSGQPRTQIPTDANHGNGRHSLRCGEGNYRFPSHFLGRFGKILALAVRSKAPNRRIFLNLRIFHPKNYSCLLQVLRTHLHFDDVANHQFDKIFPQLPGNVGQDDMLIGKHDPEHRSGQYGNDFTNYFYVLSHPEGAQR